MRIVSVCPNPAIDVSCTAERVLAWHKTRATDQSIRPGGGGINIARVLHTFGIAATVVCPVGGDSGPLLRAVIHRAEVEALFVPVSGDTRISFNVHEHDHGAEYRLVPDGPIVTPDEVDALRAAVQGLTLGAGDVLVLSGSLAPGTPTDFYRRLAAGCAQGVEVIADSSGAALSDLLQQGEPLGLALVKPSVGELERLAGRALDEAGIAAFAQRLVADGRVRTLVVSMGAHGALLVDADGVQREAGLRVPVRSAVGAGDSLVGAMLARRAIGASWRDAFAFGLAAGAACASSPGAGLCDRETTEQLYADLMRSRSQA